MAEVSPAETRPRRPVLRGLGVGLVVVLAVVSVPFALALLGGGDVSDDADRSVDSDATQLVRAAVSRTADTGSYETDFTTHTTPPTEPQAECVEVHVERAPDTGGESAASQASGSFDVDRCVSRTYPSTEFTGHSVVNLEPYAMVAVTSAGTYGRVTLHVNSTTVWQQGGASVGYGPGTAPGTPLSQYSRQVVGSLGPGPGALAMIGLASRGGQLNLEEEAVASAEPAGTGSVDGIAVTYYDVRVDLTQLANTPNLSDVQRETIEAALPILQTSGYEGTSERIGVGDDGFVREVTATNSFADGSTSTRHSVLANFGCAPTVYTPDQTPPDVVTTPPCATGTTTTTEPPPTTTSPTATVATTTVPTAVPSTGPASTTVPAPGSTTSPALPTTTTTER